MIQIDSLIFVFMVEAIGALLLLVAVTWFFHFHNKKKDRGAANNLVNELQKKDSPRNQQFSEIMAVATPSNQERIDTLVNEVANCERALYRQIIKMFLNRDNAMLAEVDKRIRALSEPYCVYIAESAENDNSPEIAEAFESAKDEIERLKSESKILSEQLSTALEAMNNVSNEYAKMFGGTKEADELEQSRKKMLSIYKDTGEQISQVFQSEFFISNAGNLIEEI